MSRAGKRHEPATRASNGIRARTTPRAVALFALIFVASSLSGCGRQERKLLPDAPAILDRYSVPVLPVKGTVLTDTNALAMPGDIAVIGQRYLVVLDWLGDPAVVIFDARTGALRRAFGRTGKGPGEFTGPWSVVPDISPARPDRFWVYDIALRRLTRVDLESDFRAPHLVGRHMITLTADATITGPLWIDDTLIVSAGFFEGGRVAQFDSRGRMLRTVGPSPPGDGMIPVHVRQHAYQVTATTRPTHDLIALATRHADRLSILRPDGELVAAAERPFGFEPRYEVAQGIHGPIMGSGDDLRFGYIDVTANERSIFALFSGRTRKGFPGRANFGNYVHVFDWHGRLQRVIELDSDALSIAIDDSGRNLYAVRHDPLPAIIGYVLPVADHETSGEASSSTGG